MIKTQVLILVLIQVAASIGVVAAPQVAVDLQTYSFPDTVEGIAVVHTFVLTNAGDQELVVSDVRVTCHCTTTVLATDRLQPGQSVDLVAVVDTEGFSNRITKTITLTTNDPTRQPPNQLQLTLVGNVVERQPFQYPVSDLAYGSYLLVDVRDATSYAAGHLIGAMNMPAERAASYGTLLPPSVLVVLYDQNGSTSTLSSVAQALHGCGVYAVYALYGGLDRWQKAYGAVRMASGADASWGSFLDTSGVRAYSASGDFELYDPTKLRRDYVLIDIRSAAAYAAGHLAGAVNLQETDISAYAEALPRETPVIVYSGDGVDSDRVVSGLWLRGSRAKSLLGGLDEWCIRYGDALLVASES